MKNCSFSNIYSDAFDSDFCTGSIANTNFKTIGNDAIDFSGSISTIENCKLENINDKAFSAGENSTLTISNCQTNKANIGLASKDKSLVILDNLLFKNCKYGLIAFTKKAEFGAAEIKATKITIEKTDNEFLIEKRSILTLDNKEIKGTATEISKLFY